MAQYDREVVSLPVKVAADSLLTVGGGLDANWILDLLIQQNVGLIEIAPSPMPEDNQLSLLAYAGYGFTPWTMPVATFRFVQLRLSKDGDATCVPEANLPTLVKHRMRREPMRPDTCLSVVVSSKSMARYELRHNAKHEFGPPFGRWELVDRSTSTVLGALTTVDKPHAPTRTSHFQGSSLTPYVTLAKLIDNTDATRRPPFQFFLKRYVQASQESPETPAATIRGLRTSVLLTKEQVFRTFAEQWTDALKQEALDGYGHVNEALVNGRDGSLRLLTFPERSRAVAIAAADRGFYVLPRNPRLLERPWIARFSEEGRLEWSLAIDAPEPAPAAPGWGCGPVGVSTTASRITIKSSCSDDVLRRTEPNRVHIEMVEIDKQDIDRALAGAAKVTRADP